MLDFTAIDFETANKYANSACSLAAVTMNDDICVKEGYTLIHPPFMVFSPDNVRIHGITPEQVANKPRFNTLWPAIRPHIDGRIIVAHYAVFDTRVLRSLLTYYKLDKPEVSYACTVEISRKVWPDLVNHKLDTVADFLGFRFHHHQALDDARACATIVCAAAKEVGASSMGELIDILGLRLKKL
ncbi:MAG: 3'-5' exonuclease [Megasphaera sp.]|jgi:DNA polymerase-3 subunit epsilon|nr:3'-5' exonuclease [Megasphaera sp.]